MHEANVQRNVFIKPFRSGEILLKTTLKDYRNV